jgi:hypothetical protein
VSKQQPCCAIGAITACNSASVTQPCYHSHCTCCTPEALQRYFSYASYFCVTFCLCCCCRQACWTPATPTQQLTASDASCGPHSGQTSVQPAAAAAAPAR